MDILRLFDLATGNTGGYRQVAISSQENLLKLLKNCIILLGIQVKEQI